ncbi:MAG: class I SAM-dependent methyltransferase [Phycisphaerae bacterium]|nr:class I SAM-dependent methyltransferase [Phycisphaerae bacterium]
MTLEELNLRSSWDCYSPQYLDSYLVSGVEDPRINGQSILTPGFPDASYDHVFCHDLIEHLSLGAMERTLGEMLRIAKNEVVLHFFNAQWDGTHEIVPVRTYHRNRVSMEKIAAFFERRGARVTCLEMARWLREKIGASGYHNPNAFSLIIGTGRRTIS